MTHFLKPSNVFTKDYCAALRERDPEYELSIKTVFDDSIDISGVYLGEPNVEKFRAPSSPPSAVVPLPIIEIANSSPSLVHRAAACTPNRLVEPVLVRIVNIGEFGSNICRLTSHRISSTTCSYTEVSRRTGQPFSVSVCFHVPSTME